MNVVAEMTLNALSSRGVSEFPIYERELKSATSKHPPPFGEFWYGERYRSLATDPAWLASSLFANAKKEGEGAMTLWKLAGAIGDKEVSEKVQKHAIDEARHARLYLRLFELVFEGTDPDTLSALKKIAPDLSGNPDAQPLRSDEIIYDEIIQMNVGEIRTMIHQRLLMPVLEAWCPPLEYKQVQRVLDGILEDEIRHIAYTADLIEKFGANGNEDFVSRVMEKRLVDFIDYTLKEVGLPPEE